MGERYLYYAERIAAFGDQWSQEFDDIAHQEKGRLNIAAPIMMGTTLIEPSYGLSQALSLCYLKHYGSYYFVAENSLEDNSIDLTIYNVHKFPENMDYQILREEEIVLVLNKNHPLCEKAQPKEGFRHPWLDLKCLKKKILSCYTRTRIPVVSHSLYLKNTLWSQRYSFTPETVPCPSALRFRDWELLLHRKVIFGKNPGFSRKDAASPLARNRFLPQPL